MCDLHVRTIEEVCTYDLRFELSKDLKHDNIFNTKSSISVSKKISHAKKPKKKHI